MVLYRFYILHVDEFLKPSQMETIFFSFPITDSANDADCCQKRKTGE